MKHIILSCDNSPDIEFKGERFATASTHSNVGPTQNRWEEYTIYKTAKGSFVCHKEHISQWQDEPSTAEGCVASSHQAILDFFGFDDLAKELYQIAGIDARMKVE